MNNLLTPEMMLHLHSSIGSLVCLQEESLQAACDTAGLIYGVMGMLLTGS